jgi:hypothetical protein
MLFASMKSGGDHSDALFERPELPFREQNFRTTRSKKLNQINGITDNIKRDL